ncbi:hypothetical protein AVEN_192408-1 [Araneus ventricosus]|uniref:Uncharacterized protein n=1 Tax=Araneus ventricosus TaxID=182803 RepID=A0A4Y2UG00_ARAVE|nr:hypothetical protein AVEN_97342-1 [Araneus ventricosus]GBO11004.1 hypothetical protein AVEN_192408-1 [Araneus ventricosus]
MGVPKWAIMGKLKWAVRSPLCSVFPQERTTYELPKALKRKERDVIQSHKIQPRLRNPGELKGPHRVWPLEGLPSRADKGTHMF